MRATDIYFVLDRSASMESIRRATIDGVNGFFEGQRGLEGQVTVTLAQFNNGYELVYDAVPLAQVEPLSWASFVPNGGTALRDALGRTINLANERLSRISTDRQVIFVTMTDGEENASQEFSHAQIQEMVKHAREVAKWEFVYLGANQDAILVAKSLNIPAGNALSYRADSASVAAVCRRVSLSMNAYQSKGVAQTESFFGEEESDFQVGGNVNLGPWPVAQKR